MKRELRYLWTGSGVIVGRTPIWSLGLSRQERDQR